MTLINTEKNFKFKHADFKRLKKESTKLFFDYECTQTINKNTFFLFLFFFKSFRKVLLKRDYKNKIRKRSRKFRLKKKTKIKKIKKKVEKKVNKKKKKNEKWKSLTKKQKKKLKMKKSNRVIYPDNNFFKESGGASRSLIINENLVGKKKYVHDGYSWIGCQIHSKAVGLKYGSLAFKTRALSAVNFFDKGKLGIKMAKVSTYKIRNPKIKRKK